MDNYIRQTEGSGSPVPLAWDSVQALGPLSPTSFDYALAGPDQPFNRGGLSAKAGLETAVILALFVDARVPDDHPLRPFAGDDPRGWWGDGVDIRTDLGEGPLGSLLWLLERMPQSPEVLRFAIQFARDALAPLIAQDACVRIDVTAAWMPGTNGLTISPTLYGRDGQVAHARQYDILWSQLAHV